MKKYIILFCLFFNISIYAQINFEKGYFINNDNQKAECLIKNIAWRYNPSEFEYKLSEIEASKKLEIKDVIEFSVAESYCYMRATVLVDESSQIFDGLNAKRNLKLISKTIFLKKLVSGDVKLYEYSGNNFNLFYFTEKDSNTVELLEYKEYIYDNKVYENNTYKQKLYAAYKDKKEITEARLKKLKYTSEDLVKLFLKINETNPNATVNFSLKQNKSILKFKFCIGVQVIKNNFDYTSNTILEGSKKSFKSTLPNKTEPNIGMELEYILPFNQKKWSIFMQPNYQRNNFEFEYENDFDINTKFIADYSLLEIPVGVRYYTFLNEKTKIFLNVGFNLNVNIKSNINKIVNNTYAPQYYDTNGKLGNSTSSFAGLGIIYKKTSIEIRYNSNFYTGTENDVLSSSAFQLSSLGLKASYIIF